MPAMFVRSSCAKRRHAQDFDFESGATNEGVSSKTQLRIWRSCGDREAVSTGSQTVKSVSDEIVIDDTEGEGVDPISAASKHTANMEVKDAGGTPEASGPVSVGGYTVSKRILMMTVEISELASSFASSQSSE